MKKNKEVIVYKFADEYTKYPGGRFIRLGKYSGEDFRDRILKPIFEENKRIEIDATGVITSFSPSFLDECFGQLAIEYGLDRFNETISFYAEDNHSLNEKMMFYVMRAISDKK